MSGLSANAKHVKDFKYPVQHSSMLPDHMPCLTYMYGMLSVSTTVCKILYIWCDVGSILSNMCLNSHCCLFVFGGFFVFPFLPCHVYFIIRTPLGEEKLLFLRKCSSLFWRVLVLHCIHSDGSPEWTPSKTKPHCAPELCVWERRERCIQVKTAG